MITTRVEALDFEAGWAVFHAWVEVPGAGIAEGTGSETRQAFPAFLEKAETVAIGRALAALGYGTAFCLDFDTVDAAGNGHLADAPIEPAAAVATTPRAEPTPIRPSSTTANPANLASPAQVRLIYAAGKRDAWMLEAELEEWCRERYARTPGHLTRSEASAVIDQLKALAKAR